MEKVGIDDCENAIQPAAVMRRLTEPLGASELAINYYELEPGDSFAFAYHSHEFQEELFCVHRGTATFETATGQVPVSAGEVIRFEPGEFQRGWKRRPTGLPSSRPVGTVARRRERGSKVRWTEKSRSGKYGRVHPSGRW
jgi:mannose-6-phosphate isomerase-like protein (cupin superfamily)